MTSIKTLCLGGLLFAGPLMAGEELPRTQEISEGYSLLIDSNLSVKTAYPVMNYSANRAEPATESRQASRQANHAYVVSNWIYDAEWSLEGDHDNDGYYHQINLKVDADTDAQEPQWVFLKVWISQDGMAWNELHTSQWFELEGNSIFDSYEINLDLLSGYQPSQYDLMIELYNEYDYWPNDSLILGNSLAGRGLTLEDSDYDTPHASHIDTEVSVAYVYQDPYYDDVSLEVVGTGSNTPLWLIPLAGLVWWRKRHERLAKNLP